VQGNLRACDRIEIKKNACVEGDMAAAHLVIEKGAHFKGRAEADGLRTRELVGNARNRGPDFRYDEDSEPGIHTKAWRCFEEFRERPRHRVPDASEAAPPPPE
jgi:hypothetical protein